MNSIFLAKMLYSQQGNNMQRESENLLQSLVSHFYSKSLHTIVGSRVPWLQSHRSGRRSTAISRGKTSYDEWFHLLLGNPPSALENLNCLPYHPMVIDIVLVPKGTNNKTVLERWIVHYDYSPSPVLAPQTNYMKAYHNAYHKSIILFRSLYSQIRLLPVQNIFRRLSTSVNTFNFDIDYQISWFCDAFSRDEEKMLERYNFKAVEAFPGRLCISVTYRTTLADLKLDEFPTHWPPKFKKGYVGRPNMSPVVRGLRPMPSAAVKHHPRPLAADPKATVYPSSGRGKGSRNFSHSFSLRKSSSANMSSSKKMEAHRAGGIQYSRTVNYGVHKIYRGNKDDSLSSYAFGVEPSQNNEDDMGRKSQNAALGVFALKLRVPIRLHQSHFWPRKMDDSLEELSNYKIIGDRLSTYM